MTIGSKETDARLGAVFGKIKTILGSKWFLGSAMFGGFAYAVVRAIIAAPALALYSVNIWVFLLIDVATVPPYVLCINRTIRHFRYASWLENMANGSGIALSFAAPYVYVFFAGGPAMPGWAMAVFLLIIAVFAALGPIRTIAKKVREVR